MSDTKISSSGSLDKVLFEYADDVRRFYDDLSAEVDSAYSILDDLMDAWQGSFADDFADVMENDLADLETCLGRTKKLYEQLEKRAEEMSSHLANMKKSTEARK